ncbi:MAG: PEP-CTERM sorting domain-containing protein [Proteobacteria bacterium]|nr:PEP-CTERM sorting domain-containing protein [Pseudomonadota bacterium]
MVITLRDLTTNTELIRRDYNAGAGGGGVDPRFSSSGNLFYTPQWQIEQLAIGPNLQGHDFLLTILGADCSPTGHTGYVYLDGFGAVTPPAGGVPEPATWAMMIMGFGLMGGAIRRQRAAVRFSTATA